jgi:hypothetical protein
MTSKSFSEAMEREIKETIRIAVNNAFIGNPFPE